LFPPYWFFVAPSHVYALLHLQKHREARHLAEEIMTLLAQTRGAGMNEIALRLACSEALHADGATVEAQAVLAAAAAALFKRASQIPEPAVREQYLSCVPANARVLKLIHEWNLVATALNEES